MKTPLEKKLPVSGIRNRFDKDVERFTNLETDSLIFYIKIHAIPLWAL
jgi:hypothetical protein